MSGTIPMWRLTPIWCPAPQVAHRRALAYSLENAQIGNGGMNINLKLRKPLDKSKGAAR